MKIYFGGSIRGGREDVDTYLQIISELQHYGEVLTEHIGDAALGSMGETGLSDSQIHDRDINWLLESDVVVCEVTNPSLGVGYEIGIAVERGKKVLCLYRENDLKKEGKRLSGMISGCDKVILKKYEYLEEVKDLFRNVF